MKKAKNQTKTKVAKKAVAKKAVAKKAVAKKAVVKITKKSTLKKSAVVLKNTTKAPVKSTSQYEVVLNHLVKHGSINTMEAIKSYNVLRLGAIIFNLRQGGMKIKTSVHIFTNKNGRKSNIAKYMLQE